MISYRKAAMTLCCSVVLVFFSYAGAITFDDAELRRLVAENNRDTRLAGYKDNETTLKLKLDVLEVINRNRERHGLRPVQLDILACRVASKTASEAVKGGYYGHYNLRGEKPYHRYAFAGGLDHASENASMRWSSAPMTKDYAGVRGFITEAHMAMYNETPPNDGHRKNILDPWHTHVGLGFSLVDNDFRYYELYIDRYLEFDAVPQAVKAGDTVKVSGKAAAPGYGVFYAIAYYEPFPSPMTAAEIRGRGSYPDFTNTVAANIAFWNLTYDDATKRFEVGFPTAKKGLYYLHIYVKRGHTGKETASSVSTRGLAPVSGIVVRAE